jgi:hypothetical protein
VVLEFLRKDATFVAGRTFSLGHHSVALAWTSQSRAYVASERDREIITLLSNKSGSRLFVPLDNTDAHC